MYPNLLGIGAAKAGTTWLYENLRRHPEVWLPPIKEINYFDWSVAGLARSTRRHRLRRWRYRIEKRLGEGKTSLRPADVRWYLRYFVGDRDDAWYAGLFPDGGHRVIGDITPGYGNLDSPTIAYVRERMPATKLVFLMRDPIDRAWSALRMVLAISREGAADEQRMIELYDALPTRDYVTTLDTWLEHYPRDQTFIGFYDDVSAEPERVLRDLCRFLEISPPGGVFAATAGRRFNEGARAPMPAGVERYIAEAHYEETRELSKRFSGHADRWLSHAEQALGS